MFQSWRIPGQNSLPRLRRLLLASSRLATSLAARRTKITWMRQRIRTNPKGLPGSSCWRLLPTAARCRRRFRSGMHPRGTPRGRCGEACSCTTPARIARVHAVRPDHPMYSCHARIPEPAFRRTYRPAFRCPHFRRKTSKESRGRLHDKTAALQGIVRDGCDARNCRRLDRPHESRHRNDAYDLDGCGRRIPLDGSRAGNYLLLVQSDGFETLTRDDVRLDAGDVVTVELTLAPSAISAAPASRLPRMPELGPPAPAARSHRRPLRILSRTAPPSGRAARTGNRHAGNSAASAGSVPRDAGPLERRDARVESLRPQRRISVRARQATGGTRSIATG